MKLSPRYHLIIILTVPVNAALYSLILYLIVLILGLYFIALFDNNIRLFILKLFEWVLGVECGPRQFVSPKPVVCRQHCLIGALSSTDIGLVHSSSAIGDSSGL